MTICDAVWDARLKWFDIGLELGLIVTDLDVIEASHRNSVARYFPEMLKLWLRHDTHSTWSALVDALRSPTVGHKELAEYIKSVYVGEFIG